MNPGQYHEVHPGQVDVESVKVDFQHRSKDRWVGGVGVRKDSWMPFANQDID